MPDIVLIQVYYRRWFNTPKDKAELEKVEAVPEVQDTQEEHALKFQVAEITKKIIPLLTESGSFYVVFKARKADGSFGYRTVIPKVFPHRRK